MHKQNKVLLQTIQALVSNKENQPAEGHSKQDQSKYCQTYGANFTHESKDYFNKKQNYKDDTLFENTKGENKKIFSYSKVKKVLVEIQANS